MTATLSDFFLLLLSASVLGGIFFLLAEVLGSPGILGASASCRLLRLVLLFHVAAPVLTALFFAWSADAVALPTDGGDFDSFFYQTGLPMACSFYGHYPEFRFLPYAFGIWLTGFVISFLARILQGHRFLRQLKQIHRAEACQDSRPSDSDSALETLTMRLVSKYHIPMPIRLCRIGMDFSPFLTGAFHPVIFLPRKAFSERHLEFILSHEIIHCRRNDVLFRYLGAFVKSLYWFNPFLPLFLGIYHERCEIACDEELLRDYSRSDRLEYARCIAGFATEEQPGLSVGFQSRRTVEHRIAAIAKMSSDSSESVKKRRETASFLIGMAVFSAAVALAMAGSAAVRTGLGEWMEQIYFAPVTSSLLWFCTIVS